MSHLAVVTTQTGNDLERLSDLILATNSKGDRRASSNKEIFSTSGDIPRINL